MFILRKHLLPTIILTIFTIVMISTPSFAGGANTAISQTESGAVSILESNSGRNFGVPGGLILPGFPTNVDANGGNGAMYMSTETQLKFKNTWTRDELSDGNSKWYGNQIVVNMYVKKTASPERITLRHVITREDGSLTLPLHLHHHHYQFIGYVFARAKSTRIMAPENTVDAAREMMKYGANYAVAMNDGVEKTMVADSKGISLGYTRFDLNGDSEGSAGTAVAGIGLATGKSGMRGFPFVQFAAFRVTPRKADKATSITPGKPKIKTNVKNLKGSATPATPAKIAPVKTAPTIKAAPAAKAKPVTFKSNVKGLVPYIAD